MKIFAIKSDSKRETNIAYLIYYEKEKSFFIEIPKDADYWDTPLILSSFVKKKINSIDSYWSKVWVNQRIVPTDRQNLGQILKENGIEEYDEYKLLLSANGRCAQDDYYIESVSIENLPNEILQRISKQVRDIIPLNDYNLLVFFDNDKIKKCNIKTYFSKNKALEKFLKIHPDLFDTVQVQPGGNGVRWQENMQISHIDLYSDGISVPLSTSDFKSFIKYRVINAAEASDLLECTRQNVNDLVKRGKIQPVKSTEKSTLFLKGDVLKRNWK